MADIVDLHHAPLLLPADGRCGAVRLLGALLSVHCNDGVDWVVRLLSLARGPQRDPLVVGAVVHVHGQTVGGLLLGVVALESLCCQAHVD